MANEMFCTCCGADIGDLPRWESVCHRCRRCKFELRVGGKIKTMRSDDCPANLYGGLVQMVKEAKSNG